MANRNSGEAIYLTSIGCKLNQSEMESLARKLLAAGHRLTDDPAAANVCVINTCAVTHVAARKSRGAVRRIQRANPNARIVVTGCYAELWPAEIEGLGGITQVVPNREKDALPSLLQRWLGEGCQISAPPAGIMGHTRALVKIQDGCDNHCTYCVVALARGRQRTRPADEVVAEVRAREAEGYREVVLTGVHIGAYGRECGSSLTALVRRLLDETIVPRLRLSSIEPWDLDTEILSLFANPRLCRHLHLPLQSGCDRTLRRMARRYSAGSYRDLVQAARQAIPGLAVTTDVIVGFPGETEGDFAESLAFVREMAFARVHIFPYSRRPGTAAANMSGQVEPSEKHCRTARMIEVAKESAAAFRRAFLGQVVEVLWESQSMHPERGPVWDGLTDNYLRVYTANESDLANQITPVRVLSLWEDGVWGEIVDGPV